MIAIACSGRWPLQFSLCVSVSTVSEPVKHLVRKAGCPGKNWPPASRRLTAQGQRLAVRIARQLGSSLTL